jgi:hypothetical protein
MSDRQCRTPTDSRFTVLQQLHEIGHEWRRRDNGRWRGRGPLAFLKRRWRRGRWKRRRSRIVKDALILEPHDPRHLLLERRTGRRFGCWRSGRRRARASGHHEPCNGERKERESG